MADEKSREPLLRVEHLTKEFPVESGVFARRAGAKRVHAVEDISFEIYPGETFGLVGESGCGKSTTGRTIMRLNNPTSGRVIFDGKDVAKMKKRELKEMRRNMQYIFQDPYASLNPRMSIYTTLLEALQTRGKIPKEQREAAVAELMNRVGLSPEHMYKYPHEFSGGQRQRIAIARAIAPRPALLLADEPVSALDVSIQSQILNLLTELTRDLGISLIFISHDLSVVHYIADNIAVMRRGQIVEYGSAAEVFQTPQHEYTKSLLAAVPTLE